MMRKSWEIFRWLLAITLIAFFVGNGIFYAIHGMHWESQSMAEQFYRYGMMILAAPTLFFYVITTIQMMHGIMTGKYESHDISCLHDGAIIEFRKDQMKIKHNGKR